MWKNAFKRCPRAVHMCWQSGVILILFFPTSVDIACLQQLIWERIFSAKEEDWNKTSVSLLVTYSTSIQDLSSAGNASPRSSSYTLRWWVFRAGKSAIWWFRTIQNQENQVLVDDKWNWSSTLNKIAICDGWSWRSWKLTKHSTISIIRFPFFHYTAAS